jgi:predicted transcriptional regulator
MATLEDKTVRACSVRIPKELYEKTTEIARRRRVSFNALLNQSLARLVEEEFDQEMYEAATLLGQDAEMTDVSYAAPAQAEVMLGNG